MYLIDVAEIKDFPRNTHRHRIYNSLQWRISIVTGESVDTDAGRSAGLTAVPGGPQKGYVISAVTMALVSVFCLFIS